MSDNVKIEVLNVDLVQRFFSDIPADVHESLLGAMDNALLRLEDQIFANLDGLVLNVRSGNLFRSVRSHVDDAGESVTATVMAGGETAPYAAIHEYGGVIDLPKTTVPVTAQALRYTDGSFHGSSRPHSIPMPERSYMRSALEEQRENIVESLRSAFFVAMGRHFQSTYGTSL